MRSDCQWPIYSLRLSFCASCRQPKSLVVSCVVVSDKQALMYADDVGFLLCSKKGPREGSGDIILPLSQMVVGDSYAWQGRVPLLLSQLSGSETPAGWIVAVRGSGWGTRSTVMRYACTSRCSHGNQAKSRDCDNARRWVEDGKHLAGGLRIATARV